MGKESQFSLLHVSRLTPNSVSPHPNVTGVHTLEELFLKKCLFSALHKALKG